MLVVDDDVQMTRLVERALSGLDIRIEIRNQAFGLLNTMAELQPHLLVLDVMMPALDGPSVVELLRSDPELSATPVLLYSALQQAELAERAKDCGADAYLTKTAGPSALAQQVRQMLPGV